MNRVLIHLASREDGAIILHDGRAGSQLKQAQAKLQCEREMTGVQFHPSGEHVYVTSDQSGKVCLRDVRMSFGPLRQRTGEGIVREVRGDWSLSFLQ